MPLAEFVHSLYLIEVSFNNQAAEEQQSDSLLTTENLMLGPLKASA
jgi:hypothetical protein